MKSASPLDLDIAVLPRIGPRIREALGRLGIERLADLLHHYPFRYIDLSAKLPISKARIGAEATVIGKIVDVKAIPRRGGKPSVLTVGIYDGTGYIVGVWYNQPYLEQTMKPERYMAMSGRITHKFGNYRLESPLWEIFDQEDGIEESIHTGRIIPVHPATKGLSTRRIRRIIHDGLRLAEDQGALIETLPKGLREARKLVSLRQALRDVHFPGDAASLRLARHRLRYDELFYLQLFLAKRRISVRSRSGVRHQLPSSHVEQLLRSLPFKPTRAQLRAIEEIQQDMAADQPMTRLLQGDVGSGKTLVALTALLTAADSGFQGALMAPTETLATQHFTKLEPLMRPLGVEAALLTGSTPAADKKKTLRRLESGDLHVVIGTHAIIEESVRFANLSLAVIDEQHRFGVAQRALLRAKGNEPDMLVMTATPIPRTLALTLYGDLNVSTLDEMPPGRQPIKTVVIERSNRNRAYELIREELRSGRQAYIICPLVEESDKIEERAVMQEIEHLRRQVFAEYRISLLHGRMRSQEKAEAMEAFASGASSILVSTTVVEVGIDVPNATAILIEGAHRFGISQLHQLRGRVGRGSHPSICILLNEGTTDEASARLSALAGTTDGFRLAEIDLKLRGEGELLGTRQSGTGDLRLASLPRYLDLLMAARKDAFALISEDPELSKSEHKALRDELERRYGGAGETQA